MLRVSVEAVGAGDGLIGIGCSFSSSVRGVTSISLQAAVTEATIIARTNGSFFNFSIVLVFKVGVFVFCPSQLQVALLTRPEPGQKGTLNTMRS